MVYLPKRVVDGFFLLSFIFFFGFWFLVFGFLLSRYSRGAWCFFVGIGLGWGWGSLYNMGKVLPSTGLHYRYMLPFLIDEMGGGMDGRVWAGGRRRQDAFAGNREPTEICHCWPGGGLFFCFYEVGWLVVLPYLTLPLS